MLRHAFAVIDIALIAPVPTTRPDGVVVATVGSVGAGAMLVVCVTDQFSALPLAAVVYIPTPMPLHHIQ